MGVVDYTSLSRAECSGLHTSTSFFSLLWPLFATVDRATFATKKNAAATT